MKFAVIGSPVRQSLSPRIHASFASQLGIDLEYTACDVPSDEFEAFWLNEPGASLDGANVTVPLKRQAMNWVDELSEQAARCRSVNTITRRDDGRYLGDSTDGPGFMSDLQQNFGIDPDGLHVMVLGAGGATWGLVPSLLATRLSRLTIANRNRSPLMELVSTLGDNRVQTSGLSDLQSQPAADLLINATSVGHYGEFEFALPPVSDSGLCYDLSYGAAHLPFKRWCEPLFDSDWTVRVCDGLGMLVEQAALSFSIWHDRTPQTESLMTELKQFVQSSII